jgi:hypothetical protein
MSITFYLSHFTESDGHIFAGPHSLLEEAAAGRAVVMAVEKPGVRFLDDPAHRWPAGGPSYPFYIAEHFRSRGMNPDDVYACWQRVRAAPDAIGRFCRDQTHRQWTSFGRTSLIGEALRSRAALFFAHGTTDKQNSVHGFDVLRAELEAAGKRATFLRVDGANHAFDAKGRQSPEGLKHVFQRVVAWYLGGSSG